MIIFVDMKGALRIFLALFIGFFNPIAGMAQDSDTFNPLTDDITEWLPPLSVILDSAVLNDPYVNFRLAQININEAKKTATRRQWSRNFGVQADIRYGTFDNFSTNETQGSAPANFSTTREEFKYGYAAYVKFPLFDFINARNSKRIADLEIDQAKNMVTVQRDEVRQLIIRQYNDLLTKQRVLRIKSRYLETSKLTFQMIEKEFLNGVIALTEYVRIMDIVTRAETDYEEADVAYSTSLLILREISGMKLKLTKNNSGK